MPSPLAASCPGRRRATITTYHAAPPTSGIAGHFVADTRTAAIPFGLERTRDPSMATQTRPCPYCGAAVLMNAPACGTCGRPMPPMQAGTPGAPGPAKTMFGHAAPARPRPGTPQPGQPARPGAPQGFGPAQQQGFQPPQQQGFGQPSPAYPQPQQPAPQPAQPQNPYGA